MRGPALLLTTLVLLTVLTATCTAQAAPNPFTSPAPQEQAHPDQSQKDQAAPDEDRPSVSAPALRVVLRWQGTLRQAMSRAALDMRQSPLGASFWLFTALAFAYGVVHALGPGHGKVLAASYFLHRGGGPRLALAFGMLTMSLHVLSATALVFGGRFLLQVSASRMVDDTGALLQEISYALLLAVGLVMLAGSLRGCLRKQADDCEAAPRADRRSLAGLALAAGLVPCPGAALVLILAISLGVEGAGLAAMLAISLGMGLSLSAVSLAASGCRGALLGRMQGHERAHRLVRCALGLAGSLAVTLMGGLLLLGSSMGH